MALDINKLNGYKVVLVRAALVNACSFMMYEKMQQQFKKFNDIYYSVY